MSQGRGLSLKSGLLRPNLNIIKYTFLTVVFAEF